MLIAISIFIISLISFIGGIVWLAYRQRYDHRFEPLVSLMIIIGFAGIIAGSALTVINYYHGDVNHLETIRPR